MNEEWTTNPADKEPEIEEVLEHCGELEIKLATQRIRIADLEAQLSEQRTTISQQAKVCDEIREIAMDYRSGEYSTPGGLEHMGDVWRLIAKWDAALATITPKPEEGA